MPSLLVFQLGGERCALRAEQVQEVVPMASLARPPGLPPVLEGFLNLRGSVTPVLRLDRLFGLDHWAPGLYTPLIVLRARPEPLALLAERVHTLLETPESALHPLRAGHCWNDCAEAEIWLEPGGAPIHLLSCERVLLAQEQRRIQELRAAAQCELEQLETVL